MALLKDLKVTIGLSKRGLTKLNADLRRTKSSFKRNFGEISNMAKNAALTIGVTLVAAVSALIKKGAEMETLRTGFVSLAGGANKAAAIVKELNEFTAKTPFQLQEVSSAARQLLAVGTERSELQKELKMLGDVAAISGSSIQDIAAIFSKVQAKGKVELENLNQLAERSVPIFEQLKIVTGDANMEFGAGAVSVEEFNTALEQMVAEGGLASGAMENLSQTVSGKMTTLMDNLGLEMGKFAEKSGLSAGFSAELTRATDMLKGVSGAAGSDVAAALGVAEEAMDAFGTVTADNVDDVEQKMADAQAAITKLKEEVQKGSPHGELVAFLFGKTGGVLQLREDIKAMVDPLTAMQEKLGQAGVSLNQAVLGGTLAAGGAPEDDGPTQTLKEFTAQFKAAAKLTEARQALLDIQNQSIVSAKDEAIAQQGLADAYGSVTDGIIQAVAMEEESPIMDEDTQQRIQDGTKQLKSLARASQMTGQVFNFMGNMVNAAFDNIKDKSQGFHEVIKAMLESLLKRAIALAATFAAISIFTGGGAKALAATGAKSFGGFMMGGLGVPQMADGGMFTGASLAMVGEGAGTSAINPEVVAPLDKLRDMMGGGNVTVTGRLDGRDILISSERAGFDRNRVRGF